MGPTPFAPRGWGGLLSQSRQAQHLPHTYPSPVRAAVIQARQILEQRTVGLIGAPAIQAELRSWPHIGPACRPWPPSSASCTRRASRRAPRAATRALLSRSRHRPPNTRSRRMDWTERYLPGGAKVYAFHTIDLQSQAMAQTLSPDKAIPSVRRHLLQVWTTWAARPACKWTMMAPSVAATRCPGCSARWCGSVCMWASSRSSSPWANRTQWAGRTTERLVECGVLAPPAF